MNMIYLHWKAVIPLKRFSGNSSALGTCSHPERHFPEKEFGTSQRHSRNHCIHYDHSAKWCQCMQVSCVGPSNPLCKHYSEAKPVTNSSRTYVGALVNDPQYGVGMIMSTKKGTCIVKFHKTGKEKHYWLNDVQKMLLK